MHILRKTCPKLMFLLCKVDSLEDGGFKMQAPKPINIFLDSLSFLKIKILPSN